MTFVLDTNVLSEPLRPEPDPAVVAHLMRHAEDIVIPAPVWHELRFGCERMPGGRRRSAVRRYLDDVLALSFEVIGYDWRAAEWHAGERARLQALGTSPPFVDGQIAAIARVNDLTLVTFNRRHFEMFDDLTVEDWREG